MSLPIEVSLNAAAAGLPKCLATTYAVFSEINLIRSGAQE
jgi:hypothetical protein